MRELEHVIEELVVMNEGEEVTPSMLPHDVANATSTGAKQSAEERQGLLDALDAEDGNPDRAAERLGVSRATIYRRMKKHGVRAR